MKGTETGSTILGTTNLKTGYTLATYNDNTSPTVECCTVDSQLFYTLN